MSVSRAERVRLDQALLLQGRARSKTAAQSLIRAGLVRLAGVVADRPDQLVDPNADLAVMGTARYVSRGGDKLAAALDAFHFDPAGRTGLDVGASTGGFTDVLLQRGAAAVIAVDVGYGQLAWSLRQDVRVVVLERVNIRELDRLPRPADFAVIDVSFISLRLVLPAVRRLLSPLSEVIALVKPQFEVGKGEVGKGGIVRRPEQHAEVLRSLRDFAVGQGWTVAGEIRSPVIGAKGNQEFFLYLRNESS